MPLFWQDAGYRQLSGGLTVLVINQVIWCQGETARPRGCLSIRECGSHLIAADCYTYSATPPYVCINEKPGLISRRLLEVYSIFTSLSVIRRRLNNASGTQTRVGFCARARRICKYLKDLTVCSEAFTSERFQPTSQQTHADASFMKGFLSGGYERWNRARSSSKRIKRWTEQKASSG